MFIVLFRNLIYNFGFCLDNFFKHLLIHGSWRSFTLIWKSFKEKCCSHSSENILKNFSYFEFVSGERFIEFQLTSRKSLLNAIRLVSYITLLWIVIFWYSLWIFDGEHKETNTGKWSDTSFLMILFLRFNEVSKIKFVNILPIKETVLDVTLVGFVIKARVWF